MASLPTSDATFRTIAPDEHLFKLTTRANGLYHAEQYAQAAAEYTKALDYVRPNKRLSNATDFTTLLFGNRSACWCMLRKWSDALRDAELAVRIRADWAKGQYRKAEALYGLERYQEAAESYEEAVRLDPESPDFRVGLTKAMIKLNDYNDGFSVVQLLAGRDFAFEKSFLWLIRNQIYDFAQQMRNFVYIVADLDSKDCILVDACWDVQGIVKHVEDRGLNPVGAIVTHYHIDHVGGNPPPPYDQFRIKIPGLQTLLKKYPTIPAYIHPNDVAFLLKESNPGLPEDRIVFTPNNHKVKLGARTVLKFLHTPGHTPGSQCVLINDSRILTGDTLFLGCCGRLDLPGGDVDTMWRSLMRLGRDLDEEVVVYPGHAYGGDWTTVGEEKLGGALREVSIERWRRKMRPLVDSDDENEAEEEGSSVARKSRWKNNRENRAPPK